ncbi:fasciclin domain protein [Medicago truncatula]|uniref:Fasciclin domain protein n=2 Tax=Medicago truncatula TaxID=3880 RepID=G7ILW6_MEDTR|nr:fasciclin domain protein [Medicago truncatula]
MFQIVLIVTIILSSSSLSSLNLSSPITSSSSSPSSSFLNLTKILYSSHTFFKAASEFHSLGIDSEIDTRYSTTVFVPDDKAFANATVSKRYESLSDDNKYFVLKCHMLKEYLPPAVLRKIANDMHLQDTVATEIMGQATYRINITVMVNGSVAVSNNIVRALVTRTLYDRSPIAVYAVSKVLMPKELPALITSDVTAPNVYCFKFSVVLILLVLWI